MHSMHYSHSFCSVLFANSYNNVWQEDERK